MVLLSAVDLAFRWLRWWTEMSCLRILPTLMVTTIGIPLMERLCIPQPTPLPCRLVLVWTLVVARAVIILVIQLLVLDMTEVIMIRWGVSYSGSPFVRSLTRTLTNCLKSFSIVWRSTMGWRPVLLLLIQVVLSCLGRPGLIRSALYR